MFCSNCGNELRQGLKYCNRCGAVTNTESEKPVVIAESNKLALTLSIVGGWIGVVGIIALALLIGDLLRKDFIAPTALMLMVIFAALIFGIEFLLIRQISNLSPKNAPQPRANENETPAHENPGRVGNAARLESYREPVGSVTEHTTRTFGEAFAEKPKN